MSTKKSCLGVSVSGVEASQLELFFEATENKPVSEVVSLEHARGTRSNKPLAREDESNSISRRLIQRVSLF